MNVRLEAGGVFYLLASDYSGDESGPYGITIQRVNNPQPVGKLPLGAPVAGTIDALTEEDAYSLQANAGDRIRVRMSDGGGLDPQIGVYTNQGERLAEEGTFGNETVVEFQAATTGTFWIIAGDLQGEETGDYTLIAEKVSP